ncbi:hypothetical protein ABZS52_26665, partial [Micromonospora profundi]
TIDGRIWTAQGVKGDVPLNHHPLVRSYLDAQPAARIAGRLPHIWGSSTGRRRPAPRWPADGG